MKKIYFFGNIVSLYFFMTIDSLAYLGPGIGGGIVASILGIFFAIFIFIFGLIWFPIKKLIKKRKMKTEKDRNID